MFWRSILPRWILSGVLFVSAFNWEALPVLACSMIVGGSTVPMIWRGLRGRGRWWPNGRIDAEAIEHLLEQRFREFEERQAHEAASLERYHAQYLADLEERLDFTERLLAARPLHTDGASTGGALTPV